jgi:hypothetical protein
MKNSIDIAFKFNTYSPIKTKENKSENKSEFDHGTSASHDFTKGPFEIASISGPSANEAPFQVDNLSNMIKNKHNNNLVGEGINDTANFQDDSYVIYKDMI